MDYKKLGERVREERRRLNLTQAQLAEDIFVSGAYVGAIERGERGLTLETLEYLANRFGVTIEDILEDAVDSSDSYIMAQLKQLFDGQPLERQQFVLNLVRMIFAHFDKEDSKARKDNPPPVQLWRV